MKILEKDELCWCGSNKRYEDCHMNFDLKINKQAKKLKALSPSIKMIKNKKDIEGIKAAAVVNNGLLDMVESRIKAGISTDDINTWCEEYLKEHNVSASDAKAIIKELKEIDLVNDNKLAGYILDSVMRTKKGPKVFYNKLFERKLDVNKEDFIYSEEKEEEIIDDLINKLYDKKKSLPIKKQKEQLYQKLLRDGFSSGLVEHKINQISFIDESKATIDKDIIKLNKKYEKLPNDEKKDKMIRSLIQKGYEYHDIIKVIK